MIQAVNKKSIIKTFEGNTSYYYVIPKYPHEYIWGHYEWADLYDDIMNKCSRFQMMTRFKLKNHELTKMQCNMSK